MTTTTTRRAILAGTATALAAGSVVNLAAIAAAKASTSVTITAVSDDPIFAAIERKRCSQATSLSAGTAG